jgi:hypothetical protein
VDIPDDQWGPALGEDFGSPSDRTVLLVSPHATSLALAAFTELEQFLS